jgi:hypothetical protein
MNSHGYRDVKLIEPALSNVVISSATEQLLWKYLLNGALTWLLKSTQIAHLFTYIRGLTIKLANSPPCAFRVSNEQKPQYGLMTLAYQHFTAVLLLIYSSLFLSDVFYSLKREWSDPTGRNLPWFLFTARMHTTKSTVKILAANTHCKYFLKIAEFIHFSVLGTACIRGLCNSS